MATITITKQTSTVNTTALANRDIKFIVVHYTAGVTSKAGSAANIATWFASGSASASSDYIVDDESIIQYNPDIANRYTWHCGGNKYATQGGDYYGICTNKNAIGIEVCSTNDTGKITEANGSHWSFTDSAVNVAVGLVKYLMNKHGIDSEHVIRHYDVNGKPCPGVIGWNIDSGDESAWLAFKQRIGGAVSTDTEKDTSTLYYVQVGAFALEGNAKLYLDAVKVVYPDAFVKSADGMYYVQVGAFASYGNAMNYLDTVKSDYPNAFIKIM